MQDPKKRRSESPHVDDARAKKRKGRPSKESTPMQVKAPPKNPPPENPTPDEDDDDIIVSTRKRKSFLRPSGATSAKKARTTLSSFKGSSALDEDDDSDEGVVEKSSRSTRESNVTTIQNGEHLNLITNPRMQSKDQESRDRSSSQYLPLKYLELSMAEYDIPSTQPQGPGGLWTCSFEDCRARVHQAGTESGQERVKEHLKTHIVKERIGLIMDESKPYLPVKYASLPLSLPSHFERLILSQAIWCDVCKRLRHPLERICRQIALNEPFLRLFGGDIEEWIF